MEQMKASHCLTDMADALEISKSGCAAEIQCCSVTHSSATRQKADEKLLTVERGAFDHALRHAIERLGMSALVTSGRRCIASVALN